MNMRACSLAIAIAIAIVFVAIAGCSGSKTCQTSSCTTATAKTFQTCMDTSADTTDYDFGGMTCTCSGGDVAACQTCSNKVAAWCQSASNCSIVGNFSGASLMLATVGSFANGSYTLTAGSTMISGNYTVMGTQIGFSDTTGPCAAATAVYNMTWDAPCTNVTFMKTMDGCMGGRVGDLDGKTLARQ